MNRIAIKNNIRWVYKAIRQEDSLVRMSGMEKNPIVKKIVNGAAAIAIGKIWILCVQFAMVPILVGRWGLETYGIWLMLTTLPTYLSLTDFGIGAASGVDMTRSVSRNDERSAINVFSTSKTFIAILSVLFAIILGIAVMTMAVFDIISKEIAPSAIIIILASAITVQLGIYRQALTAVRKFSKGQFINDLSIPLEGAFIAIIAISGYGILEASAVLLIGRVMLLVTLHVVTSRSAPWINKSEWRLDKNIISRLLEPSIAAFSLTLSNALGLQGAVMVIGLVSGPETAAIYATVRMFCRAPMQFSGMLARASIPELTRSQELGNRDDTKKIIKVNIISTTAVMLPFTVLMVVFGERMILLASRGEMVISFEIVFLMAFASLFTALWTTLIAPAVAMNQQGLVSRWLLVTYAINLIMIYFASNLVSPYFLSLIAEAVILCAIFIKTMRRSSGD